MAVTAPPGELERTYRVFLEELPAAAQAGVQTTGVQMLTRVGIPVFLQARVPTMRAGLSEIGLSQGVLHFQVDNLGNTHFVPDGIHVRGLSASGEAVVDKTTDGWYILGHGARRYRAADSLGGLRAGALNPHRGEDRRHAPPGQARHAGRRLRRALRP